MAKDSRHVGAWIPSLDALEDRQLLSPFGGPMPREVPVLATRDFAPISFSPRMPDHSPGPIGTSHLGPLVLRLPDLPGDRHGDGHALSLASRPDFPPRISPLDHGLTHAEFSISAPTRSLATPVVSPALAAYSERLAPVAPPVRPGPGSRGSAPIEGADRDPSRHDDALIFALGGISPTVATSTSRTVDREDAEAALSPSDTPPVTQTGNPRPASPPVWSSLGIPQGAPFEPGPQMPQRAEPVGRASADSDSSSIPVTREPGEIPSPRGADLITHLVPFALDSIEDSFSWLVDRVEGLGIPLNDEPGGMSQLIPIVTALGAVEIARRWRRRRSDSGTIRAWRTRSSVLHGFF